MKLVVIIPCYNEEKTIGKVIDAIPGRIPGVSEIAVLVINDGSSDNTEAVASKAGAEVITSPTNKGVGAAFILGVESALERGADLLVNIDGDGQFDPRQIPTLVGPIIENKADFVSCSRFKDRSLIPKMSKIKIWGNKRVAGLVSFLSGQKFYDVSCGFRAYSKKAMLHLNLFGKFTYTQESFLDLAYKGLRVMEVPLKVRGEREFGKSRVASNLFAYGFKSLKIIVRTIRDYRPLKFFGYTGILIMTVSVAIGTFFLVHWFQTGAVSPYKTLAFIAAYLGAIGFIIFVLALMADMLDRIRLNQEKLLYYEKKREFDKKK